MAIYILVVLCINTFLWLMSIALWLTGKIKFIDEKQSYMVFCITVATIVAVIFQVILI